MTIASASVATASRALRSDAQSSYRCTVQNAGLRQIAIAAIPLHFFLDEVDGVSAQGKRFAQRAIGRGVAVAP